ncbi:MAG: endosialidase [Defluviitaleaceae bacterium]|nr:endosialidase [Defluviitaleaceae bacterium]
MAVISEIIRAEADNTLSFGNYTVADKQKSNDFKLNGHTYKVKTYNELTRLECDDKMLLETVPGTAIHNLNDSNGSLEFAAEGSGDTQFTVGLEPDLEYNIFVDGEFVGMAISSLSGKINFGIELREDFSPRIKIAKV